MTDAFNRAASGATDTGTRLLAPGADFFLYDARFRCGIRSMQSPFECVLDVKASLGECPVWSVDEQVLYWVDINAPSLNRFDPATGINTAWPMPQSIGCFALRASGGFVAALRDGFWLVVRDGRLERRIVDAPYDPAHHRFNDGRADPQGRFWAGSMNEKRDADTAALYRLDPSLDAHRDGPGHHDFQRARLEPRTRERCITPTRRTRRSCAWDFDAATGAIANRRVFAHFAGETDRPDGAAVDREGCYWSAFYRGGQGRAAFAARRAPRRVSAARARARRCARSAAPISRRST